MHKVLNTKNQDKTAITFLSGSAGELDWILPIIDFLLKKEFNIKIIFLTRHAYISVQKNRMINDYISQQIISLEVQLCGGYFYEKIEHLGYLAYRASIKLKLAEKPIIKTIYNLISRLVNKIFKKIFFQSLPTDILHLQSKKCLIFSEFPSLKRPRDFWLREKFDRSIFFYHPHSPHIYSQDLDKQYQDSKFKNFNNKSFLLLGHPSDYSTIDIRKEIIASGLEKLFIGHPKYSNSWLHKLKDKSKIFRSSASTGRKTNIFVISRGSGSYLDEESHAYLVKSTIGAIHNSITNYNLLVKKHPREKNSHWDIVADKYPSITIIDDHILNIATTADLVITFWSSGAMDCYELGVPVVEFYDPNKHSKQQYFDKDHYTTIYRKLGLVYEANNEKELKNIVSSLLKNNFNIQSLEPHPFYIDLIDRSNKWKITLDNIISANGFLDK